MTTSTATSYRSYYVPDRSYYYGGPALAYSGGVTLGYATIEMSRQCERR